MGCLKLNTDFFNFLDVVHSEKMSAPKKNCVKVLEYVYQYKDHLNNIRLSYSDANNDGQVLSNEIIEEKNYYPFGLKHKGYNGNVTANVNSMASKFGFNGMELEDSDIGGDALNLYEMDMRQYDPAIGRWTSIDPVTHFSMSTYTAFDNNPVFWADPSGADSMVHWEGNLAKGVGRADETSGDGEGEEESAEEKPKDPPVNAYFSIRIKNLKKFELQLGLEYNYKLDKLSKVSAKSYASFEMSKKDGITLGVKGNLAASYSEESFSANSSGSYALKIFDGESWGFKSSFGLSASSSLKIDSKATSTFDAKQFSASVGFGLSYDFSDPVNFYSQAKLSTVNGAYNPSAGTTFDYKVLTSNFSIFDYKYSIELNNASFKQKIKFKK